MEYKVFGESIVLRLEKGEEVLESIKILCEKEDIKAGSISGIGASNNIVIGLGAGTITNLGKYLWKK